ncbi:AraC family transcriptional regulator [Enterobacillus tribolii]|uniref:AraC-like DNA-binding protein n=1 Tax=Enterobacillus tribolii TaxID=1487935 RepID=A0A370QQH9_9GAMM|nr:AraC family transcriptional regulator [Enterobacillus tribolii]MBW7981667.1 AraC family transcriptional regulator [Enterobacillus tribolii]RDK91046.1 AraC-like DNA-binding protein [Enterobacillus tribolii]
MPTPRHITQSFRRSPAIPYAELRSTWHSHHAYKRHTHPQLSLGAIVQGETHSVCQGRKYHLHEGDLILIAPNAVHSCNPVGGGTRSYHMLYLKPEWCLSQLAPWHSSGGTALHCPPAIIRDPRLFQEYLDIVDLMTQQQTDVLPQRLSALLQSLPGLGVSKAANTLPYSERLQTRLLADLQSPPTLDQLAGEFSLRKETLIRHFRRETGLTPGAFLSNARVEFARERLRAGDDITDVGYQSGFADQSHFHKTFVNYTASTPGQYAGRRSISDNS